MELALNNLTRWQRIIFSVPHWIITGTALEIMIQEYEGPQEEYMPPVPPEPVVDDRPITATFSELHRRKAWGFSAVFGPALQYRDKDLRYIEVGDYLIIPASRKYPTRHYRVVEREGSRLYFLETQYLPRYI